MRELAVSRVRFEYRRLTVLLRRKGWLVNTKRIYRLRTAGGRAVLTKARKKVLPQACRPLESHGLTKGGRWTSSPPD